MEPEYKEFIKIKTEKYRHPLINAEDSLEKLYRLYSEV